jgi:hypothetical protein
MSKSYVSELTRRCFYMEQILGVRCADVSLDTDSLQRMYEELHKNKALVEPEPETEEDDDDAISLNEEVCTIDPVQENVTRWYPLSLYVPR